MRWRTGPRVWLMGCLLLAAGCGASRPSSAPVGSTEPAGTAAPVSTAGSSVATATTASTAGVTVLSPSAGAQVVTVTTGVPTGPLASRWPADTSVRIGDGIEVARQAEPDVVTQDGSAIEPTFRTSRGLLVSCAAPTAPSRVARGGRAGSGRPSPAGPPTCSSWVRVGWCAGACIPQPPAVAATPPGFGRLTSPLTPIPHAGSSLPPPALGSPRPTWSPVPSSSSSSTSPASRSTPGHHRRLASPHRDRDRVARHW